ncbi:OmpA family protein [Flavobacterium sp. NKUCC04_CG]|uniref:OmpA/MotB family protein n=1 Tax=Flavobacterium sp. NKUCC04_CG TaxID=2842121 RepID=UPI001C5A7810|nr:OmpA family protein [Flavobacterium sp. NKUCC04_CG]MBW3518682.1 OmpA family protein [Flavobacterium sp. NKUCC04_CG]
MKKIILGLSILAISLSSCGSQKKIAALESKNKEIQDLLNTCTIKLNTCLTEKESLKTYAEKMKVDNEKLFNTMDNLTSLSSKGAQNLEKSLESMKEKDLRISRLQDAVSKKDSITLALVTSLKREVGFNDPDIEVNVEKGVVFISIADKLLFKSGSYVVSDRAKEVLAKVAKVVNSKPDFECMVEGHTDNVPIKNNMMEDNWDLSVKRATSITRILQNDLGVKPEQLIAAGRSYYVPLVSNDTPENRQKNRRTRIIIMPRIDQFYDMIEKEMKILAKG